MSSSRKNTTWAFTLMTVKTVTCSPLRSSATKRQKTSNKTALIKNQITEHYSPLSLLISEWIWGVLKYSVTKPLQHDKKILSARLSCLNFSHTVSYVSFQLTLPHLSRWCLSFSLFFFRHGLHSVGKWCGIWYIIFFAIIVNIFH